MSTRALELAYGHGTARVQVPDKNFLGSFEPHDDEQVEDEAALLRHAMAHPIGSPRLRELLKPGQKIAIVTSDLTRPCPTPQLMPYIEEELQAAGIPDADVTIVIALGLHRAMTEAELQQAVGDEAFARFKVINHDVNDCVRLGVTRAGTPVEIFRPLVEADVRICLGNLEFHYFAGFSGGAKAILPGCASRATVTANHSMMVRAEAAAARLAGNPVREDLEEGVAMLGVDFILNVGVDVHHRIVAAVAGELTEAHRVGCELVAKRGKVDLPARADIVLVSAGGYPKDINLYQGQKALDNAKYAVKDGGVVILAAECIEGLGNRTFEEWLMSAKSPDDLIRRIQDQFVLGGHKAAAIAVVQKNADVFLVSAISTETVQRCGLIPFDSLQAALDEALRRKGAKASILALPQGGSTLPMASDH